MCKIEVNMDNESLQRQRSILSFGALVLNVISEKKI